MITGLVQTKVTKFPWRWLWPLLVAGVVIWESDHGRLATPKFADWIPNFDKFAHFCVYGLLATLLVRARPQGSGPMMTIIAVSIFGLTDEWHQYYVPGRSCDVMDWVADTAGAALAVGLYCGWSWYRRTLEAPLHRTASAIDGTTPAS